MEEASPNLHATPGRESRRESRGGTPRGAHASISSPRHSPAAAKAAGTRGAALSEPPSWVECTERLGASHAAHASEHSPDALALALALTLTLTRTLVLALALALTLTR